MLQPMIDMANAITTIVSRLRALPEGHFVEVLTFKKDRSIKVTKLTENDFLIQEKGYETDEFTASGRRVQKILKKLLKKEFPRSNKAHLHSGKCAKQ